MSLITPDETYYLRFANLMFKWAPQAVRVLFDTKHPPVQLAGDLQNAKTQLNGLRKRHVLNRAQWNILYKNNNPITSLDFDVTLMICLLRSIDQIPAPITGFDNLPNAQDVSCGADLARIKYYRNIVAHPNNATLNAADFNSFWAEVEGAIRRLAAGTTCLFDISYLKVARLDPSDRDILLELQALRLAYASKIPKIAKDKIIGTIKAWTEEDVLYYETAATRSAIEATRSSNCLLVIGNPGTGKSALIQHVALQYEANGYSILPVSKPSHIVQYYEPSTLQVFVIHDPFGERELDIHKINKWKRTAKELETCFRNKEGDQNMNCRLFISCSSFISNTDVFRKDLPLSFYSLFDLNDDKNRLSIDERRCILQSYIGHSVEVSLSVLEIHDNFPLICERYSSDQHFKSSPETYLQFPLKAYSLELNKMKIYYPHRYCALASFVFFKDVAVEKIKTDMAFESIMKQVFVAVNTSQEYSNTPLLRAFKEMRGIYIHQIYEQFRLTHPMILDIIGFDISEVVRKCVTSKGLITCVLQYAQYSFIETRVRPIGKLLTDYREDNFYIFLAVKHRSLFIKRMLSELRGGNFHGVFTNPCMHTHSLQSDLYLLMRDEQTLDMVLPLSRQTHLEWSLRHPYFSDLKEQILSSCASPILHWAIAYGWRRFLNFYLRNAEEGKQKEICILHRETVFVLALFSQDLNTIDFLKNRIDNNLLRSCVCAYCNHITFPIEDIKHKDSCCMDFPHLFVPVLLKDEALFRFVLRFKTKLNTRSYEQARINDTDPFGNTCLMLASYFGNFTIVSILLQKQADVNATNARNETPLILACYKGNSTVVNLLIENSADLDILDDLRRSALFYACRYGFVSIVKALLQHGALTDVRDFNDATPLLEAYRCGHFNVIKVLLASKADINIGPESYLDRTNINNEPLYFNLTPESFEAKIKSNAICSLVYTEVGEWYNKFYYNMSLRQKETLLAYACSHGQTETVSMLLINNDLNKSDKDGNTPLIRACQGNHKSIVETLLLNGAHVDAQTAQAMTALMFVCQNGNTSIAKLLLHYKGNVNHRNIFGETCLLLACKNNHEPIVNLLLQCGRVVNTPDIFGQTPLFHACKNTFVSERNLKMLIDYRADCNSQNDDGVTPLMKACCNGSIHAVKQLLQGGALVNTQDFYYGSTSLMKACQIGHEEIVSLLLQYNADINIKTKSEVYQSALTIVCEYGGKCISSMMLDKGHATRQNLDTSLLKAAENGHFEIVKQLLENKADVNAVGSNGKTPLMAALKIKHSEIAYFLLTKGGSMNQNGFNKMVNHLNSERMSMLHFACKNGDKNTAEDLINRGANVNLCDIFQSSYLLEATRFGSVDVVELLLKHNADPNLSDDTGKTPVHVAIEKNFYEILNLLLDYSANVNIRDYDGSTPLMLACLKGMGSFVLRLLMARANVNAKDSRGFTSLMNAVSMNHLNICRCLLSHGADMTIQAEDGSTALSIAKSNDNFDIINILSP